MKIDVFPHILPKPFFDKMTRVVSGPASFMQKRTAAIPCLYDMDERFRMMDLFDEYVQVLTIANPPIEAFGGPEISRDMASLANDGMAELCVKHPDRFLGFAASLPMNDVDGTLVEIDRAINEQGALGVQIFTNVNGLPLDDPRFAPFWAKMAAINKPIWVHPARTAAVPDYPSEEKSKYELWWVFGWPYETAIFMSRIALSGILDRYPDLTILTHHGGSIVPHLAGRIGPGMDQLGARSPDEDLAAVTGALKKRPYDYYKMFYGDTALFGAGHAIECAMAFLGLDRMMFGTDMPFDPERGTAFIRWTIENIEEMDLSAADKTALYEDNARRILGIT